MAKVELSEDLIPSLIPSGEQEEFYDSLFLRDGSFGIRVNKKGKKSFFLIYRINEKRKRLTLGRYPQMNLEDARTEAERIIDLVLDGRDPASERKAYQTSLTFKELCELFIKEYVETSCNQKTKREYKRVIQKDLLSYWSEIKAVDIKKDQVVSLLDSISNKRGSKIMAKRVRALISRIFNFGVERGICETNPVKRAKLKIEEFSKDRVLTEDEIRSLWGALKYEDVFTEAVYKLLLLTGQRPKDLISMKWDQINFDCWRVTETHELPLTKQIESLLKKLREENIKSDFVFPSTRKDGHITSIQAATRRLNKTKGLISPFSPFDLRRTAEYYMREIGIRQDVIEEVLNRKSKKSVFERKDIEAEKKSGLIAWNKELMRIVGGDPRRVEGDGKVVSLF